MFPKKFLSRLKIKQRGTDKFSPCLTTLLHANNSDIEFLYTIRDFVSLYIFTITLNIFPFILLSSNLCQSPSHQTVSNAFEKSTNTQYIFFFLSHHRFCSLIEYVTLSKFKGDLALTTEGYRCIAYFNDKQSF